MNPPPVFENGMNGEEENYAVENYHEEEEEEEDQLHDEIVEPVLETQEELERLYQEVCRRTPRGHKYISA